MAQPVILIYDERDTLDAPITSTAVVTAGDLVDVTASGYIYKMDAAGDDATFVGLAVDSSATAETTNVTFAFKCIAEIDALSGSYRVGAGLKYSAANSLVDDDGANTIAWVAGNTTAATRIKILVDVPALQKKFEVNA